MTGAKHIAEATAIDAMTIDVVMPTVNRDAMGVADMTTN
jgi:hypothetical protein